MTPVEDSLSAAFRAKAAEVPPDAVPPLRLPARRRALPLAHGGGESKGAPALRGWLMPAAATVLVAAVIAVSVALSHVLPGRQAPGRQAPGRQQAAAATSPAGRGAADEAAQWIAAEVSPTAIVSCDPVMCQALRAHKIPAADLEVLRGAAEPLGSAVIVATAAVRSQFGGRLSSVYAPWVIASFGSGSAKVDVRVIAPGGAAAYRSALTADVAARKAAGSQLLRNEVVLFSATARTQLLAGRVDSRLLITIAAMAAVRPVSVVAFGDSGPGADAGAPLRSVDLSGPGGADLAPRSAYVRFTLTFLSAQRSLFHPARAELVRLGKDRRLLRIEFAAPSPLGLLAGNPGG